MMNKITSLKHTVLPLLIVCVIFSSCALTRMATLAKCEYKLNSIDQITIAGVEINPNGATNISFSDLMTLTSSYSSGSMPTDLDVILDIKNPNATQASMSKFDWKIAFKDTEVAQGTVDNPINVGANSEENFKLSTKFDLMNALSNLSLDEVKDGLVNAFDDQGNPKELKVFIKPYMSILNNDVAYPDFIEITKYYKKE